MKEIINLIKQREHIESQIRELDPNALLMYELAQLEMKPDFCMWKQVDNGVMGFHDMEYETTCGQTYEVRTVRKENYCCHCGRKTK